MKNYKEPKLEIIKLEKADVITTSGGGILSLFTGTKSMSSDRGINLTSYRID
ncbi:MAG: hypothetical protein IJN09_02510 [Oscillospiraceae bacterium]|nr:hypothetical protein [Oscillospiraceae bacterium]